METFFKISEFAKLTGTSRETLIYYDRIDLIKPTCKDEKTGYRYYSKYQTFEIRLILMLREIGISIKDIKKLLQNNNIDENIDFIMKYEKEVDKRIERLTATKEVLNEAVRKLYSHKNVKEDTPIIKNINYKYVISMDVNFCNEDSIELIEKIKDLPEYAKSRGVSKLGDVGAVLSKDLVLQGHNRSIKSIFGIIKDPNEYANGDIQNYGLCGCIYHRGDFVKHIRKTADKLLKYIYENGYEVIGDPIAIRIIDESNFTSVRNGLIEILIPIEKVRVK